MTLSSEQVANIGKLITDIVVRANIQGTINDDELKAIANYCGWCGALTDQYEKRCREAGIEPK